VSANSELPKKQFSRRRFLSSAGACFGGAALVALTPNVLAAGADTRKRLPAGAASSSTLITVAHADDNLLFMSPDEISLIQGGGAVQVVYLTTGDAGRGAAYWHSREQGAKAATAYMAGVSDVWRTGTIEANGYTLTMDTLTHDPRLTIVVMRLPDGGVDGSGYHDTKYQSLKKLWTDVIPTITNADGASFTTDQLAGTLAAIAELYEPNTIFTQDFSGTYGNGDHTDHITTGLLTAQAATTYSTTPCAVVGYQGYPISQLPANVSGTPLEEKEQAFLVYSEYDSSGCTPLSECFTPGLMADTYGSWFERQYVAATIPAGATPQRPSRYT
jgi:LmbE family N-acetylglucosaminyl deacetylase